MFATRDGANELRPATIVGPKSDDGYFDVLFDSDNKGGGRRGSASGPAAALGLVSSGIVGASRVLACDVRGAATHLHLAALPANDVFVLVREWGAGLAAPLGATLELLSVAGNRLPALPARRRVSRGALFTHIGS